jgi:uncharacterized protein (DUF952 family)
VSLVYKIVPADLWRAAQSTGVFAGAPVDLADGFIHFSTAAQVQETADKHFAGLRGLLLVALGAEDFGADLRWEKSRGGALFPHLYASLKTAAARAVDEIPLGSDGRHDFSGLLR